MLLRAGSRRTEAIFLIATVAIGLATHLHGLNLAKDVRDIFGDALWAMMIFWLVSLAAPMSALVVRVASALAICFLVEFSQLLEHPLLDAVRSTSIGHLVIGSDFDARDLAAYAGGILLAVVFCSWIQRPGPNRSVW